MSLVPVLVLGILACLLGLLVASFGLRSYLRYRGERLVTCPETKNLAAVEVAAVKAGLQAIVGEPHLQLSSCSRWPEKLGCGQECLAEIEAAPERCLVRSLVSEWYEGRTCSSCHRRFESIPWTVHRPGLLDPAGVPVEWKDLRVERLPEIVATHRPICWDCLVTESLRNRYPDLVTYRRSPEERSGRN